MVENIEVNTQNSIRIASRVGMIYVDPLEIGNDAKDRKQVYKELCEKVQKEYPDYTLQIAMDTDFSEE